MTLTPFTYKNFEETRDQLISAVKSNLSDNDKDFLLSFKMGEPKWELAPWATLQNLPAVKWKLRHIKTLKENNPHKHTKQYEELLLKLSK